ncbi:MAG: citrate synthase [Phycisphaeraceae bacterium]|nr:citrate synthase [Phycisphaerales bacterium]QOJ16597.1 MAG: citrate synthase [Phycisphaeraceae bacterium]
MSATASPASKPSASADTRGLAGQTVGDTQICAVTQTELIYRGYEIADLAANATFEEVAFLLLVGHKPSAADLKAFNAELIAERAVDQGVLDVVGRIAKNPNVHPMAILRTGVSLLSHVDPEVEDNSPEAELRKAKRLLAKIPTIIGYGQMSRDGKTPVKPDPSLNHAANLLWCMTGVKPAELDAKVMDVSLILYAEHDFNASTFACRVIASTESDMHGAVCGGISALKGPLHGGANEMAMEMLKEIDGWISAGKGSVRDFMHHAFATKRKLMGFGHRVYKNGDHRAGILRGWGLKLTEKKPHCQKWFDIGDEVQAIMLKEKNIHPNVDFPCGMTYFTMGIPVPQYTPIFVASRITGWCAHIMEQHANNRIIRPLANYTGPGLMKWKG